MPEVVKPVAVLPHRGGTPEGRGRLDRALSARSGRRASIDSTKPSAGAKKKEKKDGRHQRGETATPPRRRPLRIANRLDQACVRCTPCASKIRGDEPTRSMSDDGGTLDQRSSVTVAERPGALAQVALRRSRPPKASTPSTGNIEDRRAHRIVDTEIFERPGCRIGRDPEPRPKDGGKTRLTVRALDPSLEVRDSVLKNGMEKGAGISYDRLEDLVREIGGIEPSHRNPASQPVSASWTIALEVGSDENRVHSTFAVGVRLRLRGHQRRVR